MIDFVYCFYMFALQSKSSSQACCNIIYWLSDLRQTSRHVTSWCSFAALASPGRWSPTFSNSHPEIRCSAHFRQFLFQEMAIVSFPYPAVNSRAQFQVEWSLSPAILTTFQASNLELPACGKPTRLLFSCLIWFKASFWSRVVLDFYSIVFTLDSRRLYSRNFWQSDRQVLQIVWNHENVRIPGMHNLCFVYTGSFEHSKQ